MERSRYMEELQAYMSTLLWQATDDEGNALDSTHDLDDFAPAAWSDSDLDLQAFIGLCEDEGLDVDTLPVGQVGHDFALTRNRHGAGFWDRGLGTLGDDLTRWAHTMGSADAYVGDDGRIYVS